MKHTGAGHRLFTLQIWEMGGHELGGIYVVWVDDVILVLVNFLVHQRIEVGL
jgi:hypothetical protein